MSNNETNEGEDEGVYIVTVRLRGRVDVDAMPTVQIWPARA